ncbi:MAG: multicopper oxidase domain-containing protein, partial [Segetibacter sp.]
MKIIIVIFLLLAGVTLKAQDMKGMKMPKQENKKQTERYTCVMHPEIQSSKPGNCPKCGMKLVKKTVKVQTSKSATQKPDMQMSKETMPANHMKDMKMDMPMPKAKEGIEQNMQGMQMDNNQKEQANPARYTCVMHPEIHSSEPGNCPKCGMKLVKEKPKAVIKPTDNKDKMNMLKDTSMSMDMDSKGNMPMNRMQMSGGSSKNKTMDMSGMNMDNMHMPKVDLGTIKTITNNTPPHTVVYHLYVRDTIVNYAGKAKRAIAVNGQIPMPTLTFTEGDTAEIWVHNELNEVTALHWHGLFVPNRMDGVPFLTQMPIKPHSVYLYKFPIIQHGTHWYHSHAGLQEQIGMYGMFIMNKRKEWDIPTIPVVLSDWTNMNPSEVNRSLHNQTDWFGIRKNTIQSYTEAIKT